MEHESNRPKEFDDDDPMELVGMVVPGEEGQLESMAECIVEEYVRMGWNEQRLITLFIHPMFLATHRIYIQKGESYIRQLIASTCQRYSIVNTSMVNGLSEVKNG